MHSLKIAVIRGGKSHEHEISMSLGAHILKLLRNEDIWIGESVSRKRKVTPIDIYVDKDGVWHKNGAPVDPHKAVLDVDKVISALLSSIDEAHDILHLLRTASHTIVNVAPQYAHAVLGQKHLAKEYFEKNGIKTPQGVTVERDLSDKELGEIALGLGFPLVVKPAHSVTSIGVTVARSIVDLPSAIAEARLFDNTILIEQYISGKEISVVALRDFRGIPIYTTIPIEIGEYKDSNFKKELGIKDTHHHDYASKLSGSRHYHITKGVSDKDKKIISDAIHHVMTDLSINHGTFDFVVHPKKGVYLLEVNTVVKAYPESVAEAALKNSGISPQEYLRYIID